MTISIAVAAAKARFSELLDRAHRGERFVVVRRGRPVAALVPPDQLPPDHHAPTGLAAVAGALEDWESLPAVVDEIYAARARAGDRDVPPLD